MDIVYQAALSLIKTLTYLQVIIVREISNMDVHGRRGLVGVRIVYDQSFKLVRQANNPVRAVVKVGLLEVGRDDGDLGLARCRSHDGVVACGGGGGDGGGGGGGGGDSSRKAASGVDSRAGKSGGRCTEVGRADGGVGFRQQEWEARRKLRQGK